MSDVVLRPMSTWIEEFRGVPHMEALFGEARRREVVVGTILPATRRRFTMLEGPPVVYLIGDDPRPDRAFGPPRGPGGYDRPTLRRVFDRAGLVVVMPGEPVPQAYRDAVACAARAKLPAVPIECTPGFGAVWLRCDRDLAPKARFVHADDRREGTRPQ